MQLLGNFTWTGWVIVYPTLSLSPVAQVLNLSMLESIQPYKTWVLVAVNILDEQHCKQYIQNTDNHERFCQQSSQVDLVD
jgi:hypothetical protein